jgi:hypothetical protein
MLAVAKDLLRGRRRRGGAVVPGATYRHRGGDASVETASVIAVTQDDWGIPHVKFHMQVSRGATLFIDEERTLALDIFRERFRERVGDIATS